MAPNVVQRNNRIPIPAMNAAGGVDYNGTCWKDLEREMGYRPYGTCLKSTLGNNMKRFPNIQTQWLMSTIPLIETQNYIDGSCTIIDVSKSGGISTNLEIRGPLVRTHATDLLKALRCPPTHACVRVLLLDMGPKRSEAWCVVGPLLDAIGLGLKIDPKVLEAYLEESYLERWRSPQGHYQISPDMIGYSIFTAARNYLPCQQSCPPVVFIMLDESLSNFVSAITLELPFKELSHEERSFREKAVTLATYLTLLRRHLDPSPFTAYDPETVMLRAAMPIHELFLEYSRANHAISLQSFTSIVDKDINGKVGAENVRELETVRLAINASMLDTEESVSTRTRWYKSMGVTNYVKDASQIIIEDKYQTYLKDMRNLEGSIRDWLSLHVSGLALEESRRSIEVSNLQIAESKRCRSGPIKLQHYNVPELTLPQ